MPSVATIALSPQVRNQSLRRERERLQLPNTDGELACRPLLPEGGDADLHGTATTLRGGIWNDGNADTGLDFPALVFQRITFAGPLSNCTL
jgi:hypothetical protein